MDELVEHYRRTLVLIQDMTLKDVPAIFRPRPWSREKVEIVALKLATGSRMAVAEYVAAQTAALARSEKPAKKGKAA